MLETILGKVKEANEAKAQLAKVSPDYPALRDWAEKKSEFEAACGKYTPKFEA